MSPIGTFASLHYPAAVMARIDSALRKIALEYDFLLNVRSADLPGGVISHHRGLVLTS